MDQSGRRVAAHQERHGKAIAGGHRRLDETGTDHGDTDAVVGQPSAQTLAPNPYGGLAGAIGGGRGQAAEPGQRGHDDDLSGAPAAHRLDYRQDCVQYAVEVDGEDGAGLFRGFSKPGAGAGRNAGIGDHQIQWLALPGLVQPLAHGGAVGDVDGPGLHQGSEAAAGRGDSLQPGSVAAGQIQPDLRSGIGSGQGRAETAGSAGNQNGDHRSTIVAAERRQYKHPPRPEGEAQLTINSMTGYARAQGQDADCSWTWEVKSVNGKGLELRTRMAGGYDFLEPSVRERLQKRFRRGNLTASLTVTQLAQGADIAVNEAALAKYVEVARRWAAAAPDLAPSSIAGLMALKGVLEVADGTVGPELGESREPAILKALDQAMDALGAMRLAEGRRMGQVLRGHLADIENLVQKAEKTASLDPQQIKGRLKQQVQALLDAVPALSEERLAQEAALLVQKGDVREELDRLKAHLAAALELMSAGEAVGRRLDFLCQEFNREANTLCSKAADMELTRIGMALKAVIEQFREQVQNIE